MSNSSVIIRLLYVDYHEQLRDLYYKNHVNGNKHNLCVLLTMVYECLVESSKLRSYDEETIKQNIGWFKQLFCAKTKKAILAELRLGFNLFNFEVSEREKNIVDIESIGSKYVSKLVT